MIDIEALKKLPVTEKLKIIDEIWESIAEETGVVDQTPDKDYEENLNQLLSERLAAYKRGETKSYTWEEVEERLKKIDKNLLKVHYE